MWIDGVKRLFNPAIVGALQTLAQTWFWKASVKEGQLWVVLKAYKYSKCVVPGQALAHPGPDLAYRICDLSHLSGVKIPVDTIASDNIAPGQALGTFPVYPG